jgi:hypothetical protein
LAGTVGVGLAELFRNLVLGIYAFDTGGDVDRVQGHLAHPALAAVEVAQTLRLVAGRASHLDAPLVA